MDSVGERLLLGAQTLACSTQTQVAWGRGWGAPRCETHTHAASSVRTREPSMQMHVCTQIYGHTQSHLSTWRLSEFAFLGQPSTGLEAPKPLWHPAPSTSNRHSLGAQEIKNQMNEAKVVGRAVFPLTQQAWAGG